MFRLEREKKSTSGGVPKVPDRIFSDPFDFQANFPNGK